MKILNTPIQRNQGILSGIYTFHWDHAMGVFSITHMLHGAGIFTNIYPNSSPRYVDRYSSTMVRIWVRGMGLRTGRKIRGPRSLDFSRGFGAEMEVARPSRGGCGAVGAASHRGTCVANPKCRWFQWEVPRTVFEAIFWDAEF